MFSQQCVPAGEVHTFHCSEDDQTGRFGEMVQYDRPFDPYIIIDHCPSFQSSLNFPYLDGLP